MASIETALSSNRSKGAKGRRKTLSTRIDLTPMVDLGFLLITFFLISTTLAKPKVMSVNMPFIPDEPIEAVAWSDVTTTTILLGKNHELYYYFGMINNLDGRPRIFQTSFEGIRSVILDKKEKVAQLAVSGVIQKDKTAAFIIKATEQSTYEDFVRILDELNIHNISMKAVVDVTEEDKALMNSLNPEL